MCFSRCRKLVCVFILASLNSCFRSYLRGCFFKHQRDVALQSLVRVVENSTVLPTVLPCFFLRYSGLTAKFQSCIFCDVTDSNFAKNSVVE
jgi:hypothetical protein